MQELRMKNRMKKRQKFFFVLAILTGIFIFIISSIQFPPGAAKTRFIDLSVVYHFGVFFMFSLFLFLSGRFEKKFIFVVLIISLSYAGLDELHQYFVPNRTCDIFDLATDFAGSLTSFLLVGFLKVIRK